MSMTTCLYHRKAIFSHWETTLMEHLRKAHFNQAPQFSWTDLWELHNCHLGRQRGHRAPCFNQFGDSVCCGDGINYRKSHGLRRLSPRTCVLQIWCRLSESNEPLSCFNQSSLSEKRSERESLREKEEREERICCKRNELHVMGLFLANTSLIQHSVEKSPEGQLTSRQI